MSETAGGRIKALRTASGLTQRGLADLVGAGFPHISKVENDRERPSFDLLVDIYVHTGRQGEAQGLYDLVRLAGRCAWCGGFENQKRSDRLSEEHIETRNDE